MGIFTQKQFMGKNSRRTAIATVLCSACLYLVACGSDGGGQDAPPPADGVVEPAFTVSVKDLGSMENNCDILMRDAGYSALIGSNSVWVYGDTFLAFPNENDIRLLSNSKSSTPDTDACDGLFGFEEEVDDVGAPRQFIPFTEEEIAFNQAHQGAYCSDEPCNARWAIWPGSIIVDDAQGLAYFFYGKIYVEEGKFNFHSKGRSIAVWHRQQESRPRRVVFNQVEGFPTLLFSADEPRFGSAAVVVDDIAYVYGCSLDKTTMTKPCHLARVPRESILDKDSWTYYQSDGTWSDDMGGITPVFAGNNMMSVFYNGYLERYVAVYTEPLKNHILLRVANRPEGPWSSPRKVWTAPAPEPSGWIYDALAHPEYSQLDDHLIYVTYSLQTGEFSSEIKLLELELSREP